MEPMTPELRTRNLCPDHEGRIIERVELWESVQEARRGEVRWDVSGEGE